MLASAVPGSAAPVQGDPAVEARVQLAETFTRDIRPFLSTYCLGCHGPIKPKRDMNLSVFGTGEEALAKPALWKDCAAQVQSLDMPPRKETKQPSPGE